MSVKLSQQETKLSEPPAADTAELSEAKKADDEPAKILKFIDEDTEGDDDEVEVE